MAQYGLKYYAEFRNTRKQDFRLEIAERIDDPDIRPSARRIGYLSGCALEVQGNLSGVISPIIKTQLKVTLVDAADIPSTGAVKYGDWEEFFTPDATLYKVRIARIIGGQNQVFWTGYITPDSWEEALDYRGQITITARDNIGHLQDFQFDAPGNSHGLIKIMDLIDAAMAKIEFPMTYALPSGAGVVFPLADGVEVHNALVNVSLFEGTDWYKALEQTLEAIGYVLRFVDDNQFYLGPLRNFPTILNPDSVDQQATLTYSNYYESNSNYTLRITGEETSSEGSAWATGSSTNYSMLNELFAAADVDGDLTIDGAEAVRIYTSNPDYAGATIEIFKTSDPTVVIASGEFTPVLGPQQMEFYGGTLELDPAVKEIIEEQDYGSDGTIELPIMGNITYGPQTTYSYAISRGSLPVPIASGDDAPVNPVDDRGDTIWSTMGYLLDISGYFPDRVLRKKEGDAWNKYAFLPANIVPDNSKPAVLIFDSATLGVDLVFTFTEHGLSQKPGGPEIGLFSDYGHFIAQIKYSVELFSGSAIRYYDGYTWSDSYSQVTVDYDSESGDPFTIHLADDDNTPNGGTLLVFFENIIFKTPSGGGRGVYARLASVEAKLNGISLLTENKVRTINNTAYNVAITRRPLFGALSREVGFVKPANYENGLFYYPTGETVPEQYPYMVHFTGQASTDDVPLPVAIHQQILCFYYGAARALSGNCAPVNDGLLYFDRVCTYKGRSYLLQGGTLDLFSGILGGAVLREYTEFSDLWSDNPPDYSEEVIYNN